MLKSPIGAALKACELAELHRPTDEPTLRCAAVELQQRGLTPRDIGQALGLNETAARQLLGASPR